MRIIRGRLKPMPGSTYEFISVKGRIKGMIEKNPNDNFDFVIEDDKMIKSVKSFGPDFIDKNFIGKEIPIIDNAYIAKFNEDGTIDIIEGTNEESLPRESTVRQLKKLRKLTKKTDIGDRISDMNKEGSNIGWIKNPIDSGIESYEKFQKKNRKFISSWNVTKFESKINEYDSPSSESSKFKEDALHILVDLEDTIDNFEVKSDQFVAIDGNYIVHGPSANSLEDDYDKDVKICNCICIKYTMVDMPKGNSQNDELIQSIREIIRTNNEKNEIFKSMERILKFHSDIIILPTPDDGSDGLGRPENDLNIYDMNYIIVFT